MKWFNNLKLHYKFGVVLVLFAIGLIIFAFNSFKTLEKVEINGDLYKEIINGKDLIADILPPPDYIVETHLLSFQMLNEYDQSVLEELFTKTKQLKEEFETRHTFWRSTLAEGTIKENMLVNSYKPAVEYFELRDNDFIPLIKSGQREEAKALLLGKLKDKYEEHRKYIDLVVKEATAKNLVTESSASEIITSKTFVLLLTGISILIIVSIIVIVISKKVANPVNELAKVAEKIALGEVDVNVVSDSEDEIGMLKTSFSKMIESTKHQVSIAEKIADGDLNVDIKVRSEKDHLNIAFQKVESSLKELISEANLLSQAAVDGKLSTRGNADNFNGGYKEILLGVNRTLDEIIKPVIESEKILTSMSSGDMTARVTGKYRGDHEILKNSINKMGESVSQILKEVKEVATSAANASHQISSSTEEMATGAHEQAAQANEVSSAVEEMTKTIFETSKNTSAASEASKNAEQSAKEGGKVVEKTISGMDTIADVVKESAQLVHQLGKSSDQIGEIVQVIDDIADQTNLLALNAAIEAARAGEQGRGFAVVADEVRKLAERTTKATKEIAVMIKQIQRDTSTAVESMQHGTSEVEKGKLLAHKAGDSLREIITGANKVTDIIIQVAAASEEQSSAAEHISKNIESISSVTQQSAGGLQQIAQSSEELSDLTKKLQDLVALFKVDNSGSTYAVRQNGKLVHI